MLRINCGGPTVVDANGDTWTSDSAYVVGGGALQPGLIIPISYSFDVEPSAAQLVAVLNTERWGNTVYTINTPIPGVYLVELLLVESWPVSIGARKFNIFVQDETVEESYDLMAEVGLQTPIIHPVIVDATDDQTITLALTKAGSSSEAAVIQGIRVTFVSHDSYPSSSLVSTMSCRSLEWNIAPGRFGANTAVCSASIINDQCYLGMQDWASALEVCGSWGVLLF